MAAIGSDYEKLWDDAHEVFANLMLILVIGPMIGVTVESYIHKENLAKAMVHGHKNPLDE